MNLVELLHASARRYARRPAVTDIRSGHSLSYADLDREARRVAEHLLREGVAPGQRIGLLASNGVAYLPAAFGLLATGACLVPIAASLTPAEIATSLDEVQVNGCLAWPGADLLSRPGERRTLAGGACDGFTFQWLARALEGPVGFRGLNPAFVRFTSGTTAERKGVA